MRLAKTVIVIGAGMGGLAAAADLARQGCDVTVLERAATPGGKARMVGAGTASVSGGPTVFTMRWIFEQLFSDCGSSLEGALNLSKPDLLARHAWREGGQLDLFADIDQSADAIGTFSGAADAQGYRDFCARSRALYETLEHSFIAAQQPSPVELVRRVGFSNLGPMLQTTPFQSLWSALGRHFTDPRLRQLFGRYSTYVGSSPWLTPATLMLVAHVEQDGVWLVDGGMHAVAGALAGLGRSNGARYRYNAHVDQIIVEGGRAAGVRLAGGETLMADAVVFNGDVSALGTGLLGEPAAGAAQPVAAAARSLSAITWCVHAPTSGFELDYHNVFFANDYAREFTAIFKDRTVCEAPTVYICAEDRTPGRTPDHSERLLILVNAPADGDTRAFSQGQMDEIAGNAFGLLADCGLHVDTSSGAVHTTAPAQFNGLFPASGGALYGRASHGMMASFARPGAASKLPGLYLAGGSVHPGPGVPMAVMSGRLAAARLLQDAAGRA
jgi:1-hydroxycarotenoid 3,4-desaturase